MYALIRYLDDKTHSFHTIPADHIENFHPSDVNDFDKNIVYSAFWEDAGDPDDDATGYYAAQIYMLGETEEDITRSRESKRMPKPRLDPDAIAAPRAKKPCEPQEIKKGRSRAQNAAWQDILRRHVEQNADNYVLPRHPRAQKGLHKYKPDDSESSDEDEQLVSRAEVKHAEEEANFWRRKYETECKQTQSLITQVGKLQECLTAQIFSVEPAVTKLMEVADLLHSTVSDRTTGSASVITHSTFSATYASDDLTSALTTTPGKEIPPTSFNHECTPTGPAERLNSVPSVPEGPARAVIGAAIGFPPFTEVGNKVHLTSGYMASRPQTSKIFSNKKGTIVVKDVAEVLWGTPALALRTPSGKSNEGDKLKLTPEKVEVVRSTLHEWGRRKRQSVMEIEDHLNAILSSKCQDAAKCMRKRKSAESSST